MFPATDTVRADSLPQDSVAADTMPVIYPIPDIIQYRDRKPEHADFLSFHPRPYDLFFDDLLPSAGMLAMNGRLVTRGRVAPARAQLALNSRLLENRIYGACDTRLIPVPCLESISPDGGDADLQTRINRYDRPYSHIRFTTLGNTTLYNLDLTRAVSNNVGFYLSGIYSQHPAAASDSNETRNAFYGNFYTCGKLSSRLDMTYSDRNLPGSGQGSLYDASLLLGSGPLRSRLYFNMQTAAYHNVASITPRNRATQTGIEFNGSHELRPFGLSRFEWATWFRNDRFQARSSRLVERTGSENLAGIDIAGKEYLGRFQLWLDANCAIDFVGNWYSMPRLSFVYVPVDSHEFFLSVNRDSRRPLIGEKWGQAYVYNPDYPLNGNPGLEDENSWRVEIGYAQPNVAVSLFRDEFDHYISYRHPLPGLDSLWSTRTMNDVQILGLDLQATLPLSWGFNVGAAGNYLFEREDESCPDYSVFGALAWIHEHGRARYEVSGWCRYLGGRRGRSYKDKWPVFYCAAAIRFITLTASARLENIMDETISDFTVPPRNITLSIQWEFWN